MRIRRWVTYPIFLAGLPELNLFETDEQRQDALEEVGNGWSITNPDKWFWFLMALIILFNMGAGWMRGIIHHAFHPPKIAEELGSFFVTVGIIISVMWFVHRRKGAKALRAKLLGFGIPVCIKCGYSLKGLTVEVGRCPECGTGFEERVVKIMKQNPA